MIEKFPLDFESLNRGDTIPAERIESIFNVSRLTEQYRFAMMSLQEDIEMHFRSARGDEVIVKHVGHALHILTHPQQSAEAQRRAHQSVRGYGRAVCKAAAVDVATLCDEERERHDRFLKVSAFRLSQLRRRPPPELTG